MNVNLFQSNTFKMSHECLHSIENMKSFEPYRDKMLHLDWHIGILLHIHIHVLMCLVVQFVSHALICIMNSPPEVILKVNFLMQAKDESSGAVLGKAWVVKYLNQIMSLLATLALELFQTWKKHFLKFLYCVL